MNQVEQKKKNWLKPNEYVISKQELNKIIVVAARSERLCPGESR